ncbi:MAG: transcriptional regulator [Piscinibacter sp.]|nr:transcriptional regulator [Piscinibacter sp.]
MPGTGFAQTKIQPPRLRPGLVAREGLEAALGDALAQQRLVLLSAPAGFGKTAALTRQLAQLPPGTGVAWVSADADDDLGRFADCLLAALDPFDLPWRTAPEALVGALDSGRAALAALASELVNALLRTELPRGLIVIEDSHRIEDPAVFRFLDLLLERLPHHWGLVVAGRVDPPLALARWRARGELAEFRQDQLRFDDAEVRRLLDAVAPGRDLGELRTLLERVEGWAAGLRLVLGSGGDARAVRAGAGQRHLFDFLASEVLDGMPAELRGFLLRCAVLPELSVARCAAVSGHPDAARLLEQVEQRGLFVSVLDEQQPVLRLHDLFRDFLEDRLARELPDELPALLQRAADGEPDPTRRIGYLARAGAWAQAEAALAQVGAGLVAGGAVPQVLRLLEQFPPDWRDASPRLAQLRGLCAWAHWDIVAMCASLEQAAERFDRAGDARAAQHARAQQVIGLTACGAVPQAMALLARVLAGPQDEVLAITVAQAQSWHALAALRMQEVAPPLGRMVEALERAGTPMAWFQGVPPTAMIGLPGTRAVMQRYVDGALARTPADPPAPLRVLAEILQAGLRLWAGEHEPAVQALRAAEADCRWLNRPPNLIGHLNTYAALAHAVRGERDAALAAADARLAGLTDDPRTSGRETVWLNHFLFFKLRVAAALDDTATVRTLAEALAAQPNPAEPPTLLPERMTLPARLAEIDGRSEAAAEGFAAALQDAARIDFYGQAREVRLRLAAACLRLGRPEAAAGALAPLFAGSAEGEPGGALLAGRAVLGRLAAADWGGHLPDAGVALLRRWAGMAGATDAAPPATAHPPTTSAPVGAPQPEPASGLSQRELEVLARLAAGDSNKLIARAFDLSPHTVKRHVANILDKLALQSRGQAAAWYQGRSLH